MAKERNYSKLAPVKSVLLFASLDNENNKIIKKNIITTHYIWNNLYRKYTAPRKNNLMIKYDLHPDYTTQSI